MNVSTVVHGWEGKSLCIYCHMSRWSMCPVPSPSWKLGCAQWRYKITRAHTGLLAQEPFDNVVHQDVFPLKRFFHISSLFMSFKATLWNWCPLLPATMNKERCGVHFSYGINSLFFAKINHHGYLSILKIMVLTWLLIGFGCCFLRLT